MVCALFALTQSSCSNKKNTAFSRFYHSVNTRYNIHFNADEAYNETLKTKEKLDDDNLSSILHIYPIILDSADLMYQGSFTTTIDKTTKAIKLHSIKTRPKRDPNKRGDKQHEQWVNQKEFNPFLVNSWMLLAKAEFQEGSYLRAITTFLYITKIYNYDKKVVSESKLWIARAYSEMGWTYEAENVLRKMEQNDEIHHQLLGMYAAVKANLYVHSKNYESAIPYLEEAINKEKNGVTKLRNKYLLAQLYEELGEKDKASKAYGQARGFSAPYHYTFNSKLRQLELSNQPYEEKVSKLKRLSNSSKNKEYLDQVYGTIGNIYLHQNDTVQGIEFLAKAIKESTRSGYDQALAQIQLGGLYFDQKKYVKAQPCYAGALPQLKKADEHYPLVALRSEVLDQLVVHAKVVEEQDSLLFVANLPELDRVEHIKKYITALKKEEEKLKKEEEKSNRQNDNQTNSGNIGWGDLGSTVTKPLTPSTGSFGQQDASDFYFYNPSTVEQGKVSFQSRWGRRPLEDNWRRKNKQASSLFDDNYLAEEQNELSDSTQQVTEKQGLEPGQGDKGEAITDKYSVEYYLQQLPLTDEAKEASYKLVEKGLFNMGLIYKNLLEDRMLAIDVFEETLSRFPSTPHKEEIYYQLFLIYLSLDNSSLMASYRDKIIDEFPKGKYTIPLSDPNYAWNFKYMSKVQETLYQETYQAYLKADVKTVRANYTSIQTKFPFVSLMPKFAFLNALTYAQTKDAKELETHLTKLVADFPQSDVTPMATNILKNIKNGMILLSDGSAIQSMDWTMAYTNDSIAEGEQARPTVYTVNLDSPHMLLLMFKDKSIDKNKLLYQVADYNFSNYVIQTYDLNFSTNNVLSTLEIKGFNNFKAIKSYINKSLQTEGLLTKLDKEVLAIPISESNYKDLFVRLGTDKYIEFYTDSLITETPKLLAYWGKDDSRLSAVLDDQPAVDEPTVTDLPAESEEPQVPVVKPIEKPVVDEESELPPTTATKPEDENDKEVNLEDVLSEEQVEFLGNINQKTDDVVESISNLGSNPVEGLKNIFNRNKFEDNLTKEEKAELKEEQRKAKEREKELKKITKAAQDSIKRVESLQADSIKLVERAIRDSIQTAVKLEQDRKEFEKKEKERQIKERKQERIDVAKQKEQDRKDLLKVREDKRKAKEREREEQLRQREKERNELQKARKKQREEKEKATEELRKQRELERENLLKQKEIERKNKRKQQ